MASQDNNSSPGQSLKDKPPSARREVAVKLGERLESELNDAELDVAWGIARQLVEDTSQSVREELAISLCNRPDLPKELGQKLAHDNDGVAAPFLAKTPLFTDSELCEIVRAVSNKVRKAIAGRPHLESELADLLAELGDKGVATILISNEGAQIGISGYRAIIERFSNEPNLLERMATRSILPPSLVAELVGYVSDATRLYLEETYEVPENIADRVKEQTESAVLLRLVEMHKNNEAVDLLKVIHAKGLLTKTLCLLIIRRGNVFAFATAISLMTGIPPKNIELVLKQGAVEAIEQVCKRANLPEFAIAEAVQHVMAACKKTSDRSSSSGKVA